jgi:hypothetical protein
VQQKYFENNEKNIKNQFTAKDGVLLLLAHFYKRILPYNAPLHK